ncbi:hypothetical protein BS47DRAFT_799962 [Hydnum rufescens UP504]|uniref:Uncharacterized protein n=1 Tax=Hydnum rufescens UP504 TaxID=1448309 RepID=A0A9P6B0H3_9AGAM|nr:hypothetical protein BS47DRAFT_799962 [Hydnum rufescens UP504]
MAAAYNVCGGARAHCCMLSIARRIRRDDLSRLSARGGHNERPRRDIIDRCDRSWCEPAPCAERGLNTDQHCLFGNGREVWLTLSMAWRLTGGDFIGSDGAGSVTAPQPSRAVDRSYGTSRRLSDTGCIPGSGRVCVVEEWYW